MSSANPDTRPLIVLVSGAPGSGKTTLARALAEHMRLLHVPRDEFFWSLTYTANPTDAGRMTDIPAYWEALVALVKRNVSIITDGTLYKGLSEPDIQRHLAPVARLVNVHCRAQNEYERFHAREIKRHERFGNSIAWLDGHQRRLKEIYDDTVDPLDLNCLRIEVDTTSTYHPSIKVIAAQIDDRNNRLKGRK